MEKSDPRTDIQEILFDEETIAGKVDELAERISRDYSGKALVLICILKGAVIFTTDLVRRISCPLTLEFVQVSSYGMSTTSSRNLVIKQDMETDIKGRHVLLVDAIIDTGETLNRLMKIFSEKKPASLNAVVLLDKSSRRTADVPLIYSGFEIPDRFVVGYGLDLGEHYRNLPYVAVLKTDQ